jgi:hypothetical protein
MLLNLPNIREVHSKHRDPDFEGWSPLPLDHLDGRTPG